MPGEKNGDGPKRDNTGFAENSGLSGERGGKAIEQREQSPWCAGGAKRRRLLGVLAGGIKGVPPRSSPNSLWGLHAIMESWGMRYVGRKSHAEFTPQLDALQKNSC